MTKNFQENTQLNSDPPQNKNKMQAHVTGNERKKEL